MLLTDAQIIDAIARGDMDISPFRQDCLQPTSVDLHLGEEIREYMLYNNGTFLGDLDPLKGANEHDTRSVLIDRKDGYLLRPGNFILGTTVEKVSLGPQISARIEGKSTLGRCGLVIHSTAGFVDPGFIGQLTLEITNLNPRRLVLRPGMRIGQLSFTWLSQPVSRSYGHPSLGSHYQQQQGATAPAPLSR